MNCGFESFSVRFTVRPDRGKFYMKSPTLVGSFFQLIYNSQYSNDNCISLSLSYTTQLHPANLGPSLSHLASLSSFGHVTLLGERGLKPPTPIFVLTTHRETLRRIIHTALILLPVNRHRRPFTSRWKAVPLWVTFLPPHFSSIS